MFELRIIKVGVKPVFFKQFFVTTFFYNVSFIHHEYHVGVLYGGKPMRYYKRRFAFHKVFERLLYLYFRSGVDGRRRFVQNHDRWI